MSGYRTLLLSEIQPHDILLHVSFSNTSILWATRSFTTHTHRCDSIVVHCQKHTETEQHMSTQSQRSAIHTLNNCDFIMPQVGTKLGDHALVNVLATTANKRYRLQASSENSQLNTTSTLRCQLLSKAELYF